MTGVRIAFSGSFSENRFSLPMNALFLTGVDYHSCSLLSRLLANGGSCGLGLRVGDTAVGGKHRPVAASRLRQ